ncbi:glycosyltransferase family 8 protein [Lysinibacillus sp. NPDC047702]|uniref:glycosyltransferase family 8 protein n=1 Tax=unclassified Lysinibacillus TaxID=2636778 RepID=UPI003D057A14
MITPINIVFAADNHYIQHLSAALTSLFENTKYAENLIINIIDGNISEGNKQFLYRLTKQYGSNLQFKDINTELLNGLVINGHITEATYYRILIPSLFDESISKVIYLDCDIIVRGDIVDFWNHDIQSKSLGAVRIYEYNEQDALGTPETSNYFNAGILLMNLEKWRNEDITGKVLNFILKYPERLISWDQDALNGVLYEDWIEVELKWNLRSQLMDYDYATAGLPSEKSFIQLKKNPSIVHFTTVSKPWHYINNHPFKEEYFYYLDKSNYPYEKYPEEKILLSKEIILFGASNKAMEVTKKLANVNLEPSYYIDNDSNKWGATFEEKEIKEPKIILENLNNTIIIIASQYVDEITNQLIGMKLVDNEHFFKDITYLSLLRG